MTTVRRILLIAGVGALAIAAFIAALTPETLRGNRRFKAGDLDTAIRFVESARRSSGALPSTADFEAWKATRGWGNRALFLQTSGSLASEDCPFGAIPGGSYGITTWRGEWNECYAAWKGGYSFDATLDHNVRAIFFCLIGALAAFGTAALLARRQPPNNSFKPKPLRGSA